jgi:hypothetical protein
MILLYFMTSRRSAKQEKGIYSKFVIFGSSFCQQFILTVIFFLILWYIVPILTVFLLVFSADIIKNSSLVCDFFLIAQRKVFESISKNNIFLKIYVKLIILFCQIGLGVTLNPNIPYNAHQRSKITLLTC